MPRLELRDLLGGGSGERYVGQYTTDKEAEKLVCGRTSKQAKENRNET